MKCQDIMRRPVQSVRPNESAVAAAQKMRDSNIGFLAVCDEHEQVQGVITDRDIALRICAEELSPSETRVEEIMTRVLVSCGPHDDLEVAEERMSDHRKSRILVTDDEGRALGVISLSDIASFLAPGATETLRKVAEREVLDEKGQRPHH